MTGADSVASPYAAQTAIKEFALIFLKEKAYPAAMRLRCPTACGFVAIGIPAAVAAATASRVSPEPLTVPTPLAPALPATTAASYTPTPRLPFPVGEELHYHVFWSKFFVGRVTVLSTWATEGDRRVLKVVYWARSNETLSQVYPVNDMAVVWIDPTTFLPLRCELHLSEGKFRRRETTEFDYAQGVAFWRSALKNKSRTFPIDRETRDLLTFLYFMRQQRLEPNTCLQRTVMTDDKTYVVHIAVKNVETVMLPRYGPMPCVRVEPTAEFEGLFVRTGKVVLWVTRDPRALCSRIEADVPIGTVRVVLSRVCGPGEDFWIRHPKARSAGAARVD